MDLIFHTLTDTLRLTLPARLIESLESHAKKGCFSITRNPFPFEGRSLFITLPYTVSAKTDSAPEHLQKLWKPVNTRVDNVLDPKSYLIII